MPHSSTPGNPYCLLPPLVKDGAPVMLLMESDMGRQVRSSSRALMWRTCRRQELTTTYDTAGRVRATGPCDHPPPRLPKAIAGQAERGCDADALERVTTSRRRHRDNPRSVG